MPLPLYYYTLSHLPIFIKLKCLPLKKDLEIKIYLNMRQIYLLTLFLIASMALPITKKDSCFDVDVDASLPGDLTPEEMAEIFAVCDCPLIEIYCCMYVGLIKMAINSLWIHLYVNGQ